VFAIILYSILRTEIIKSIPKKDEKRERESRTFFNVNGKQERKLRRKNKCS
jgi:hypothetical protein